MKAGPPAGLCGEAALSEFAQRVVDTREGWRVVHLRLSKLQPVNRRDHHLRIVANTVQPMLDGFSGERFALGNNDLVLALRGAPAASLDQAALSLRYLFGADPAAREMDEAASLLALYDLGRQYDEFLAAVAELEREEKRRQKRQQQSPVGSLDQPERVDLHRLADLVDTLSRADLSNFVRRQSVCAVLPEGAPETIFQEVYMSIPDMMGQLMPEMALATDRWLFQHVTQTLDRRMLDYLRRNPLQEPGTRFSLNINISTLLSPEFDAFEAALTPQQRGCIILEIQLIDIFGDLGTFFFARDYARSRGFRFCLDGLDDQTLAIIDRDQLGVDLLKLVWNPAFVTTMTEQRAEDMRKAAHRIGRHRLILSRCGEPAAIKFGQSLGIALYQGRQIERMTFSPAAPNRQRAVG